MPKKEPKKVLVLQVSRSVASFAAAGLFGVTALGLGISGTGPALGADTASTPAGGASAVTESASPAQNTLSDTEAYRAQVRESFMSLREAESGGPEVELPINQTLVAQAAAWKRVLPAPLLVPVETEWVAGFNIDLLSDEKIAEILAEASQLKDVEPFAPGSGANSNERMGDWLSSDRTVVVGTPRAYAVLMLVNYGWGLDQWPYLDRMWWHESGWDPQTVDEQQGNSYGEFDSSKTWGIPQANPASKMASAGDDWMTNPETQIRWGLGYIKSSYGSPQEAWEAWRKRAATGSYGWY